MAYENAISVLVNRWEASKYLRDYNADAGMSYLAHEEKLELLGWWHAVYRTLGVAWPGIICPPQTSSMPSAFTTM
jgi:hypothetical protein